MANLIKGIKVADVVYQIDYKSLANLPEGDMFVALYGSSSLDEILEAYNKGKCVSTYINGGLIHLSGIGSTGAVFKGTVGLDDNNLYTVVCSSDGWDYSYDVTASRSFMGQVTIKADDWMGDEAPYYAYVDSDVFSGDDSSQFISVHMTNDDDMNDIITDCGIRASGHYVGRISFDALYSKPESDVTLIITVEDAGSVSFFTSSTSPSSPPIISGFDVLIHSNSGAETYTFEASVPSNYSWESLLRYLPYEVGSRFTVVGNFMYFDGHQLFTEDSKAVLTTHTVNYNTSDSPAFKIFD